ncbi:MAG: BatA domain-containing protein [Planctomycetia bacterium]|nr:BatA domain-containing protein [Planctomycetia bacterium]
MFLVHPLFLLGFLVAGVPILLHFLMKRQPRKLNFPAIRFLQSRERARNRSLQLRHWLLLATRVFLVLVLVLLFARPGRKAAGTAAENGPVSVLLVLDTSPRMGYRFENQTFLERAKKQAYQVLATLPAGSQAAVISTFPSPQGFLPDLGEAERRVRNLVLSPASRSMTETLGEVLPLLENVTGRREVYLFTDAAENAWPGEAGVFGGLLEKYPGTRVYWVDVGEEKTANMSVEIPLSQAFSVDARGMATLEVRFGGGDDTPRTATLWLYDASGQLRKRDERQISGESVVTFPFSVPDAAGCQGEVRLEGTDALPFDNRAAFTIPAVTTRKILLAATGDDAFFVERALRSAPRRREAAYGCEQVSYAELSGKSLGEYQAIFLLDPPALSGAFWNTLRENAENGLGVGIALGPKTDGKNLAIPEAKAFLPALPEMLARHPEGVVLIPSRTSHPIRKVFSDLGVSVPWDVSPVFRYWQLGAVAENVTVVFRFPGGDPAILERRNGLGTVLLCATPLSPTGNDAWNLLPSGGSWPFLVLVNAMADHLTGSERFSGNVFLTESVSFPTGISLRETYTLECLRDDGVETLPLTADRRRRRLDVPKLEHPGNYRIPMDDGVRGFSVQLPPSASDLTRVSLERRHVLFAPYPITCVRNVTDLEYAGGGDAWGYDPFTWLASLFLGGMLLELILANRFYSIR